MYDRILGLRRFLNFPALVAVTAIAGIVAFIIISQSSHKASSTAKTANTKADKTDTRVDVLSARQTASVKCLLNARTPTRAARCLNITLPRGQ